MRTLAVLLLLGCSAAGQELLSAHPAANKNSSTPRDTDIRSEWLNVTGTYKGSWRKVEHDPPFTSVPLLVRKAGALFYRITASNGASNGVRTVEGEMVVRDGELHTEDDLTLHVKGVYVEDSKRLHAILEPTSGGARAALQPQDFQEHTSAYRQALRDLANDWVRNAEEWHESDFILERPKPMQKRCEFVLDLALQTSTGAGGEGLDINKLLLKDAANPEGAEEMFRDNQLVMNGTLLSETCGVALELNATSTQLDVYYSKAIRYTLMITGLSFLQVLLLLPQIEATSTQALMSKVSLLTVGQQAIMDAYLCLLHLTTGIMVDPLFNSFATAAFLEFVIFAIFETRYMLMIWRVRRSNNIDPWAQQRELSILYARFYSALLTGIFISYQLQRWMHIVVFGVFSFWVPQIALCAYQDARQPLKAYYVVGMSLTRMALPLYLYGCPHNLLRNPTSPTLCLLLSAYMLAQVALLLGQAWFGPRFFIPSRFLPPKYDYFRAAAPRKEALPDGDIETGDAGAECVICMNPVDVLTPPARMLTPCNHVFHPACLQRWMDVKMECPTCRAVLPPR